MFTLPPALSPIRDVVIAVADPEKASPDRVITGEIDDFVEKSKISSKILLQPGDEVSIKNFTLVNWLGTGLSGKVFLVKKRDGFDKGTLYAMKVLEKIECDSKHQDNGAREVRARSAEKSNRSSFPR